MVLFSFYYEIESINQYWGEVSLLDFFSSMDRLVFFLFLFPYCYFFSLAL
ncbi:MAG: hypothetical protein ACI90V_013262, partial [Bacillariaceae sp.]